MGTLREYEFEFMISHTFRLWMRHVSDKTCIDNQNTNFMFKKVIPKSFLLWDSVENLCKAEEVTEDIAHAHCMLDT